jgi:hypothetical protein
MMVFDAEVSMDKALPEEGVPQGKGGGGDDHKSKKRAFFSDGMNGSGGIGVKASLGSREVRFEMVVSHKDIDRASAYAKKMKESELGKGDEGTPPQWFKDDTSAFGDKKITAQLVSNIGFGSSGDLFFVKSAVDTADLQQAGSMMGKVLGISNRGRGGAPMAAPPGGGAPGGGPPGGRPPGVGPPGGRPPGSPKTRRRRDRARR